MIVFPFQPKNTKNSNQGKIHDDCHEFEVHAPKKQSGEFRQNTGKNNPVFVVKAEYVLKPDGKRIIHVSENRIKIIPGGNIHRVTKYPIEIDNTACPGCCHGKNFGHM